jgi:arachidonate 15-lipoxygenase
MACPETYNTWGDMSTDESFSRYFFNGFGVVGLAAQKETSKSGLGPFEVDIPIQDFEVRPGFRPYGARVHFDADQKPTGIFDYAKDTLVKPGDDDWESAKWLAKSTAFTLNTVKEHLMWGHLTVSNSLTFTCTNNLPPDHPIRRLLTIFTYRTNTINDQAFAALVPDVSTLHRATSLTYPALQKMFEVSYTTCDAFEPFCE